MKKFFIVAISLFLLTPTVRTQSQNIPKPPFNLKLSETEKKVIKITWEAEKENIQYFSVERKGCQEINFIQIARKRSSQFEYFEDNVIELEKGKCEYTYRILACNENGCSAPSNELTLTYDAYITLYTTATCYTPDHKQYTTNDLYHTEFNAKEAIKYFRFLPNNRFKYRLINGIDGKYAEIYITLQSLVKQHIVSGIYFVYMPLDARRRPLWDKPETDLAWNCDCSSNDEMLDCYPLRYGEKKSIEYDTDVLPDETASISVGIYAYDYMTLVK